MPQLIFQVILIIININFNRMAEKLRGSVFVLVSNKPTLFILIGHREVDDKEKKNDSVHTHAHAVQDKLHSSNN